MSNSITEYFINRFNYNSYKYVINYSNMIQLITTYKCLPEDKTKTETHHPMIENEAVALFTPRMTS